MKKLSQYFLQGLLLLVPLSVTVYVVYIVFIKIDGFFPFKFPGIGFAVTIMIILSMGFAASNILTKHIFSFLDLFMARLPLVKMLYTALKDLINAFVGDKRSFNTPVIVSLFPNSNLQLIGFMTRSNLERIGICDHVAVYFPQSFNYAGNLLIVPKDQVTILNAGSKDVMSLVVSGGISFRTK
ncbi:MAG: DUF502 domain-containing protein [Desulfobacterales bacterium]|nr:DUF502 domain-containing protein [Desulfobacterales bacterium]